MKIIGMLPVYNDEDIIQEVIEHLISQEIPLVVLDNGSTDNTYKICEKYVGKGILGLRQYSSQTFQSDLLLRMLYDMALTHSPDWVIRSDSDEILESGVKNQTLKEAITQADAKGDNLIQFDRFDFFMTDDDNESAKSIKEKLRYYSHQGDGIYRAWKVFPGIRIGDAMGHYPIFPEMYKYKISPQKLILRHYPLRSKELAEKKMKYRVRGRSMTDESKPPFDYHERNILKTDYAKKVDHQLLTKYGQDDTWDYEIKYYPFTSKNPPKKNEIFTENGSLKNRPKTLLDYRIEVIKKTVQLNEIRAHSTIAYRIKRFIRRRLKRESIQK